MKLLSYLLVCTVLTMGSAHAGSNAGVVLAVHGNQGEPWYPPDPCEQIEVPEDCIDLIPSAIPDPLIDVYWYLILVVSPRGNATNFNMVTFGLGDYTPSETYIGYFGSCKPGALEAPTAGWPAPGTGTAVAWTPDCSYGQMVPVYYFGIYVYAAAGEIPLVDHPLNHAAVADCSEPATLDLIEGFGAMGYGGAPGWNPECPPWNPEYGACCFGSTCLLLHSSECLEGGGDWFGGSCEPNPCQPTPRKLTTWGGVKSIYQ
ncbi:MAG: hypothetical protein KJ970_05915 [Candidatus Eisenbacteria bacterium]|uniref:C3H1-type domain-containing protein n=1 Tax=Eiseniibacteriota bacterium TaxID=2212470 RepID=A0A948W6A9_UNCEI|nr:hypothetical protein [Candidatus Eisenbacteria bacterium]MBU1949373.1 hypothetical protein [Candidatus Eisenbacteria bacterium]MBU2690446.1 hypothetical protein [Candidatus Eisenbacteria bacterium]